MRACSFTWVKIKENFKKIEIFNIKFVDFFENKRIISTRMDTYNEHRMATAAELSGLEGKKLAVGARQLKKALLAGRVKQVFLAQNADPAMVEPIAEMCRQHGAQALWVRTMMDLGRACGIEVGAAAAAAVENA